MPDLDPFQIWKFAWTVQEYGPLNNFNLNIVQHYVFLQKNNSIFCSFERVLCMYCKLSYYVLLKIMLQILYYSMMIIINIIKIIINVQIYI